jgi:hypothetical protein
VITSSASPISKARPAGAGLASLVILGLVLAFPAASGSAEGTVQADELGQLRARLERLSGREGAVYAEGAIEHARDALARVERATDDPQAQARARETARAAMALGERQLHLREVQAELIATQRRLTSIRERADAQRRVLEALMKERALLARGGGQP